MKVAYLIMAYSPDHYYRRICNVDWQDYPDADKTLILLHQREHLTGQFPAPLQHDLDFKIIEINVEGDWPALWGRKLWAGVDEAIKQECEAIVWFDEDDEYHPAWTKTLVGFINEGYDIAWSWVNRDVKKSYIRLGRYDAPSGAMIVRTKFAKHGADIHKKKYPLGKRHANASGSMDLTYCKMLISLPDIRLKEFELPKKMNRFYPRHQHANTKHRLYSEDIDAAFDYGKKTVKQNVPQKPKHRDVNYLKERK